MFWFPVIEFLPENKIEKLPERKKETPLMMTSTKTYTPVNSSQYPILKIGTASNLQRFDVDTRIFASSGMCIGIFAQKGSGKSNTTGVIVEELLRQGESVIIFDFEGEWHSLRTMFKQVMIIGGDNATVELGLDPDVEIKDEDLFGIPPEELKDGDFPKPGIESRVKKILHAILENGASAVFDLSDFPKPYQQIIFSFVADSLFKIQQKLKSNVLLIVDEAAVVAPEGMTANTKSKVQPSTQMAMALATRGRKRGIDRLWATQRTAQVSKTVIGQCDMYFFGKMSIEQDFKPIKHFVVSAGITFDDLKRLQPGQFYCVYQGRSTLVHVRKMACVHAGATPERKKKKKISEQDIEMIEKRLG